MGDIIRSARQFAEKAYEGQTRKYTNETYINHPVAVASLVNDVGSDNNMIAAALLHDIVEDTPITIHDISKEFSNDIACLVDELTDISKPADGNRKARKEIDRMHTAKASDRAKTIKLADLIDNSKSIIEHDPEFAKVYIAEKKALLEVLSEGNILLFNLANRIVDRNRING